MSHILENGPRWRVSLLRDHFEEVVRLRGIDVVFKQFLLDTLRVG